ncbi:molecular chaperone GrpE [Winogradskyella epiphytica]|uniref:Protein GrpE n=1 Tax=Winogradskyella epiphytica TaxID=262005 RepID=A0A2V4XI29_9FLAO|nr:nucleotide exchange factor GrpE [Winogradskyella epiphytica]PYE80983.1 molecular chaperone GrpE [Winogradskyella epiphytica]GGW65979.1 protein GrpE [Winogradskyella epiphytica]
MSKKDKNKKVEDPQVEDQATVTAESEEQQEETKTAEEQLQDQLVAEKEKFMRLFAEFENYKKRTTKERIELFKTASQDVMLAMLPILDDFERALAHIEETEETGELRKGVLLIQSKLIRTLEQKGLAKIEVRQGDVFNADNHEAVTQIPAPSDDLKGKIIDVVEQGYKLGDKVIRFPKVVVGQ